VLPEWGDKQVESIEKSDVAVLLTKIAEKKIKGPKGKMIGTFKVARTVRVQLSTFYNWYVEDHGSERFRSPIVKSQSWSQPSGRERVLEDDEIRAIWRPHPPPRSRRPPGMLADILRRRARRHDRDPQRHSRR